VLLVAGVIDDLNCFDFSAPFLKFAVFAADSAGGSFFVENILRTAQHLRSLSINDATNVHSKACGRSGSRHIHAKQASPINDWQSPSKN
jgi:hypothetical protein